MAENSHGSAAIPIDISDAHSLRVRNGSDGSKLPKRASVAPPGLRRVYTGEDDESKCEWVVHKIDT